MDKKSLLSLKVEQCKEEIVARNCRNFVLFSIGGMLISATIVLIGILMNRYTPFIAEFFSFFLYFIVLYFIAKHCQRNLFQNITIIFYMALIPLSVIGIAMGTFLDAKRPAITIMVFLCVLTLFILDKAWKILLYITLSAIGFLICSYCAKSFDVFRSDLVNTLIYYCVAIGVNYFALKDRIESAQNYIMVREQSQIDPLTKLYNRRTGEQKVESLMNKHVAGTFVMIDVDKFKYVNDTFGHQVGDKVLCEVANLLKQSHSSEDVVWRLGGDEFALFLVDMVNAEECKQYFDEIYRKLQEVKIEELKGYPLQMSLGCIIYKGRGLTFSDLYKLGDKALYQAKEHAKGKYCVLNDFIKCN